MQVTPDFPVLLASCPLVQFEASTVSYIQHQACSLLTHRVVIWKTISFNPDILKRNYH
jgi:hypothetical protein